MTHYNHITEPNPCTFVFFPTSSIEVKCVIKSLKNKGSSLHDISVLTLKKNSDIFSEHISLLYNLSIETQTFPNLLKVASVIPGHKDGPRDNVDNYRPISNLPILAKIFEKLTLKRFSLFANSKGLIHENQYGFQKGKSITQAAVRLTTLITHAYNTKSYAVCFFLDL